MSITSIRPGSLWFFTWWIFLRLTPPAWIIRSQRRSGNLESMIKYFFCNRKQRHMAEKFVKSRESCAALPIPRKEPMKKKPRQSIRRTPRSARHYRAILLRQRRSAGRADTDKWKQAEPLAAIALGLAGDSAQAERLAADLGKHFPEDTIVHSEYLPMIAPPWRFTVATASEPSMRWPRLPLTNWARPTVPSRLRSTRYLRGQANLAAKQGAAAVSEFQRILDHASVVGNAPIGALARLGLGRAHVLSGDTSKAKTAYQDFFALWKNADPEIPILQQAKAEYARLK